MINIIVALILLVSVLVGFTVDYLVRNNEKKQKLKHLINKNMNLIEFKKGDYIVYLGESYGIQFQQNYVFKQRESGTYLLPYNDGGGSDTNGWSIVNTQDSTIWRYATSVEIAEYDKLGKPYDVTTLKKKDSYEYEVVHCTTQEDWNYVNSKLEDNALGNSAWNTYKEDSCKEIVKGQYSSLSFYKSENSKIYSFKEWCKEFGHKGLESKQPKFEIGKWYNFTTTKGKYNMYGKLDSFHDNSFNFYNRQYICNGKLQTADRIDIKHIENPKCITDLSVIQQYLPDGHVDKTLIIPEYIECITGYSTYIIPGLIYKVIDQRNALSIYLTCNIKSYYTAGNPLYVSASEFTFKPSTKEAFDKQKAINTMEENKKESLVGRYVKSLMDYPNGGSVKKDEYGLIVKDDVEGYRIDFPSQKNYFIFTPLSFNKYNLMPEGFKPQLTTVKEESKEDLLAEAKRRYPVGCEVNCLIGIGDKEKITSELFEYRNGNIININLYSTRVYRDGKWAEIVSKPEDKSEQEWVPKIGDWCFIISRGTSHLNAGNVYQLNNINLNNSLQKHHFNGGSGRTDNSCWLHSYEFRKALPHEIPTTKSEPESTPELTSLPDNWCIEVNDKTRPYIKEYRTQINYKPFDIPNEYSYQGTLCGCIKGIKSEITLEQFKKWVLKSEETPNLFVYTDYGSDPTPIDKESSIIEEAKERFKDCLTFTPPGSSKEIDFKGIGDFHSSPDELYNAFGLGRLYNEGKWATVVQKVSALGIKPKEVKQKKTISLDTWDYDNKPTNQVLSLKKVNKQKLKIKI